jgi:hypothetical protein
MRTLTERKAARRANNEMIARLRQPAPEQAEQAVADAAAARTRIAAAGDARALPPGAYLAERSAMLQRLRAQ